MKKYKINPSKNIGNAIFIVEGAASEFKIAKTILGILEYDYSNFAGTNLRIYDHQEQIYNQNKKFRLLSLFCALMELGIIEEETDIDFSESRKLL